MPKGSDVYSSPWLKAADLEDDEQTFTIIGSDINSFKEADGKEKQQIVLEFRETEKRFGLNVTNYSVLRDIFKSDDSDDWHGHQIVLFVTQTTMTDGRQVDCLRIKRKATEKLLAARSRPAARPARQPAAPAPKGRPQPLTQAEADAALEREDDDIPFDSDSDVWPEGKE